MHSDFASKNTGNRGTKRYCTPVCTCTPKGGKMPVLGVQNGTHPYRGVPLYPCRAREFFYRPAAVLARITLGKIIGAFLPLLFRAGMM